MNTNEEDKKLAQVLKQGAHDPGENPWFTRRVLNKLPEKQPRGSWATTVIYAIAAFRYPDLIHKRTVHFIAQQQVCCRFRSG